MTSARLDVLFGDMKSWLPDLLANVVARQQATPIAPPVGPFPTATQRELGLEAMKMLGFDFNERTAGRERAPVLRRRTGRCAHHHTL